MTQQDGAAPAAASLGAKAKRGDARGQREADAPVNTAGLTTWIGLPAA
jgi:hypothetical protein